MQHYRLSDREKKGKGRKLEMREKLNGERTWMNRDIVEFDGTKTRGETKKPWTIWYHDLEFKERMAERKEMCVKTKSVR